MKEKPRLQVRQSQLALQARFQRAVPRLLVLGSGVLDLVLDHLDDFGARIEGIRLNLDHQTPAETSLVCSLLGGYGSLTLSVTGFTLWFRGGPLPDHPDVPRHVMPADLSRMILATLQIIEQVDQRAAVKDYSAEFTFHAEARGCTQAEIIAQYVQPVPRLLGEVSDSAVRFSFRPGPDDLGSRLALEPSSVLRPDGLFVGVSIDFDGETAPIAEAPARLATRLEALEALLQDPELPLVIE